MDVWKLQDDIHELADAKNWFDGEDVQASVYHILEEANEALDETEADPFSKEDLENEMSDIIFMTLSAAKEHGLDLKAGFKRTMKKLIDRK